MKYTKKKETSLKNKYITELCITEFFLPWKVKVKVLADKVTEIAIRLLLANSILISLLDVRGV